MQRSDAILGSDEERRTTGNIAFENFPSAHPVSEGNRSYLIGPAVEKPRQADAPAAATKVYEGLLEEHQIIQKSFLEVCVRLYPL